jgi:hypothetical protein
MGMKSFKQFLTEMPGMTASFVGVKHDHSDTHGQDEITNHYRENIKHDKKTKSMGTIGKNYHVKFHPENGIYMVHKKTDTVHLSIQGSMHNNLVKGGKAFQVDSAMSHSKKDKNIKYHDVIHHLISKGHVDHWVSDESHTKGSYKTYKSLTKRPGVKVKVETSRGLRSAGRGIAFKHNYSPYKSKLDKQPGRFVVSKK